MSFTVDSNVCLNTFGPRYFYALLDTYQSLIFRLFKLLLFLNKVLYTQYKLAHPSHLPLCRQHNWTSWWQIGNGLSITHKVLLLCALLIYIQGRQKCLMLLHQDMVIVKELWFFWYTYIMVLRSLFRLSQVIHTPSFNDYETIFFPKLFCLQPCCLKDLKLLTTNVSCVMKFQVPIQYLKHSITNSVN